MRPLREFDLADRHHHGVRHRLILIVHGSTRDRLSHILACVNRQLFIDQIRFLADQTLERNLDRSLKQLHPLFEPLAGI